jgi:hypothetical protein
MIWSNNPSLVNIFGTYFDDVWKRAEKFKI